MSGHIGRDTGMNRVFNRLNGANGVSIGDTKGSEGMDDSKKAHQSLVEWLNEILPYLNLPTEASEEDLRVCLMDGTVFCSLLNQLSPGSIRMGGSFEPDSAKVERFLMVMEEMALPTFELSDLEQGDMVPVMQSLKALKASFSNGEFDGNSIHSRRRWSMPEADASGGIDHSKGEDSDFFKVFPLKEGSNANISDARMLDLMEPNSLRSAPTQSLFSMLNKILDDSVERMNGNVSHALASLLRTIVQVIEHRISTQAENLKNQNILFRVREEKYRSRIKVLETLAAGTTEEIEIVANRLEQIKLEKVKVEEKEKLEEQDVLRLRKEKDHSDTQVSKLKQELDAVKKIHKKHCLELEARAEKTGVELEKKVKELEVLLADSGKKVKELENFCESKSRSWEKKECAYKSFIDNHSGALQELKATSESIKYEVFKTQESYFEDLNYYGLKLRGLADAAQNYHFVLEENRKLYNEVQDLKGNIRVYCRIRPFLPGQNKKQTTIDYMGENGELVVVNPSKQGKDAHRLFKFNKVFGPAATQEEVFLDTQPLVRSVLDGYNVCIFAYGQTGSGKTYTMSGPSISSKEGWGVNYRALNDLFQISQSRQNSIAYEVGVQMVEIYNEQVRDLLSNGGSQRRLGIWSAAQPNGLAVPEASMHSVKSTEDVLELMNIGLMNRAVGATALNERSSRSHSILTVHARGMDLETDAILRGSLHLVDLAGSERVDRSEATGDRLKEAQHINKSLSALGDVIFALAQKSPHVPYRNSKLTQVLQSSLGGQAKTLMFVQINPDVDSYSETISALKFAERVSGVELGAARSNKEGRDVRQLMEQVGSLKDIIAKKDEEIEHLQQLKGNVSLLKRGLSSLRNGSPSPRRHSIGPSPQGRNLSRARHSGSSGGANSDADNRSEYSEKHSEAGSQPLVDEFRHRKEFLPQAKVAGEVEGRNLTEDIELLGFGDADSEERLSDISDGCLSMGTETDGSISSAVELTLFPETAKPAEKADKAQRDEKANKPEKVKKAEHNEKSSVPSKLRKPTSTLKPIQTNPSRLSVATASSSKVLASAKKTTAGGSSSTKPLKRRS